MKLVDIMRESLVFPSISAHDKGEALRQMVRGVSLEFPGLNADEIITVIMERERLGTTGIGSGIALPHAKSEQCPEHIVAFGRSRAGVEFDAIDGQPVHLIFLIMGPLGSNETHLRILARISKFLHDSAFRDRLITAETSSEIFRTISEKDDQY